MCSILCNPTFFDLGLFYVTLFHIIFKALLAYHHQKLNRTLTMKELLHAFQPLIFCKGTNCMFGSKIDQIICKESFLSRLKTLKLDVWWPRIFDEGSVEQRVILENDNICIRFKWQFCDLAHSLLQKTYHQYCCAQSYEGCWNIYAGAIAVRSTFAFIIVFDRVPYLRGGQKLTFFSYAQNVVSGYHYVCGLLQMIMFLRHNTMIMFW